MSYTEGRVIRAPSKFLCCCITPDCSKIIAGLEDGTLRIWNSADGSLFTTLSISGHACWIHRCSVSPDGATVVYDTDDHAGTVIVWKFSGEFKASLTPPKTNNDWVSVTGICITPDCKKVVVSYDDTNIRIWNLSDGGLIYSFPNSNPITCCCLTNDGSKIIAGSTDNSLLIWRISEPILLNTLRARPPSDVFFRSVVRSALEQKKQPELIIRCCCVSSDGSKIISGSDDNTARIWNAKDGTLLRTLNHRRSVMCCCTTVDNEKLITGCRDNTVRVWRMADGTCVWSLIGHFHTIKCCAVFPSGDVLSGGKDKTLRIWKYMPSQCTTSTASPQNSLAVVNTQLQESPQIVEDRSLSNSISFPINRSAKTSIIGNPQTLSDLEELDVEDVILLLNDLGLSKYAPSFRENEITGSALLMISEEEMKTELGIKALGDRKKLLAVVLNCKESKHSLASSSTAPSKHGILVHTVSTRFSLPESESIAYKGILSTQSLPERSCKEELLANQDQICQVVPHLAIILEDVSILIQKSILLREAAQTLITACNLSNDEIFALVLYSYDVRNLGGEEKDNFFFQFNEQLRCRSNDFSGWRGFLAYLKSALLKLPDYKGTVFRGSNNPDTAKPYRKATEVFWSAFSSTSSDREVAKQFSGDSGVIFHIEVLKAKSIAAFSAHPAEAEVLLPPNASLFVIQEAHPGADGITEVNLMEKEGSFRW